MNAESFSPLDIPGGQPRRHPAAQLAAIVAERVKRLVSRKGRSLAQLAEVSGLDPAELTRIQSGEETPTINHLWRIANALGVPFGSLIASKERPGVLVFRKREPHSVGSIDGNFVSRPLFPYDCQRPVEFYHVAIGPSHFEQAEAHAPGTKENIVVAQGSIEVIVGKEPPVQLDEGDAVDFIADVPHSYRNLGVAPASLYVVISYEAPADDCYP
jgi:transcriptional regulator with XRE-family HTH domain